MIATNLLIPTALLFSCLLGQANAAKWPEYSQACADEAGPPYGDDDPNGKKYHEGSKAIPSTLEDGKCAIPLQGACAEKPTKEAYLEGPINCGDNGWYCRIMPAKKEDKWPPIALKGDVNFGHCNSTDGFDDDGFDQDGHCHGSDKDNVYYWWIRDHWFRQYNGHLRCCCGWESGSTNPIYKQRIANRCDYRRQVSKDEDREKCRDANEEDVDNKPHGKGFELGCKSKYENQIGKPIPEDDDICWELRFFGASGDDDDSNDNDSEDDNDNDNDSEDEDEDEDSEDEDDKECVDSKKWFHITKTGAKKKCNWYQTMKKKLRLKKCKLIGKDGTSGNKSCPVSCKTCDKKSEDEDSNDNEDEDSNEDEECTDDEDWVFKKNKKEKDCDYFWDLKGKTKKKMCKKKGTDGRTGNKACPMACGKCKTRSIFD